MGVTTDIRRSFAQGPRIVIREHLARGPNEARALAFLMIGCGLVVVAQLPALARDAAVGTEFPLVTSLARGLPHEYRSLDVLLAYTLLPWLIIVPLAFYGLASVSYAISRVLGGQGTPFGSRLALFWSWLAASPLSLLTGVLAGFTGDSVLTNVAGVLWIGVFATFWWMAQREAAQAPHAHGI